MNDTTTIKTSLISINQIFILITISFFIWSVINPHDYFVWFLETFPILIAVPIMITTRKSFPLSNLIYRVIFIHMIILTIGGHYTYAQVPFFNFLKEFFGLARNDYDKIGHFMQGVTPALLTQEIIWRKTNLRNKLLIIIFSISVALSISALYEIFEWVMAITTNSGDDFIGAQGDVWDTQKDMFTAFIGATLAILVTRKRIGKFYS